MIRPASHSAEEMLSLRVGRWHTALKGKVRRFSERRPPTIAAVTLSTGPPTSQYQSLARLRSLYRICGMRWSRTTYAKVCDRRTVARAIEPDQTGFSFPAIETDRRVTRPILMRPN